MSETEAVRRVRDRIGAVGEALGVPDDTIETAEMLLSRARVELEFEGRNVDAIAAAALLIACKQGGLPITLGDVASTWESTPPTDDVSPEFEEKLVSRRMNTLTDALSVPAPPTQPTDLTDRYAEEIGMPEGIAEVANNILRDVLDAEPAVVAGGTSPSGSAAAALYLAAKLNGLRLEYTQDCIAEVAGTTEVTIRTNYQRLAEALGGEEELETLARYRIDREPVSGDGVDADTVSTAFTVSAGVVALLHLVTDAGADDESVETFATRAIQAALSDPEAAPSDEPPSPTGRPTTELSVALPVSDVRLLERTVNDRSTTAAQFVEAALRRELGVEADSRDRSFSLPAETYRALDLLAEQRGRSPDDLVTDFVVEETLE